MANFTADEVANMALENENLHRINGTLTARIAALTQERDLVRDERIGVAAMDDESARVALVALPGIGPWTAEVYLLSALRRPDTWPVGDIALQEGARRARGLGARPSPGELAVIGEAGRPHRATAARLLWHRYLSDR